MNALRLGPERGPVAAAGGVILAVAVFLTLARFEEQWASGVHFVILLLSATVVLGAAWATPVAAGERPPGWLSTLLVAGLILDLGMLLELADVLGAEGSFSSGTLTWVALIFALESAYLAVSKNSAVCLLIAAIATGVEVVSFVDWVFEPEGVTTFRWIFFALILTFAVASFRLRAERPRHAAQAMNAAGLAALALSVTFVIGLFTGFLGEPSSIFGAGFGWELVLVASGLGLVAYSVVEGEPGPGYLGGFVLLAFTLIGASSDEATLIGWPIVLILAAIALLAAALRPGPNAAAAPAAPPPPPPGEDQITVRVDE